ncbi:putative ATPase/DNA-binding SARP family transcriptional activator [Streptomyces sp. PvR006]|uniref:BTAD domain-containing putative transcriptional regulator n=1 Tax=Streptomyces sp. PvR006 TaxID=2817860 RepID=UPI001AE18D38|nr:BTAD domain-containing putative transcriptional regulator [Streptomyces sp. PvR006]MBP2580206.1 putative ATPase/DNA-binding SARP family transcriptional activator [Streptomyces sp. PvR006]
MQPPYRVLGPCQALRTDDGTEAVLSGARLRALLTALAAAGGRPVGTHALIDQVWGDADRAEDPDQDRTAALQALVGRLRRAVGREAVVSAPGGGYRLAAAPDAVDLHRFERLAAEGAAALGAGDPARAAGLLDEALGLWRGPALADLPGRDTDPLVVRVEQRHTQARRDRLAADLALGRATEILAPLAALAAGAPLDEPLQALRIRALRAAGRPAEALAGYEEVRAALADRLGTDPGPELRALHAELLTDTAPASPVPAPPAPTGRGRAVGLPARLTSFIGRDDDLGALAADWGARRLVTLTGPGGVGKTRLALKAAETYRDGPVHLAELASVREESTVVAAVLSAVGARETHVWHRAAVAATDPEDPFAELVEHCAGRRMLLVLDNCEHVVAAAAELAHVLLTRCPDVTVLATSREPLGVPGEVVRPLGPLPAGMALRLLGERGAAARAGFAVAEDREAAEEVCRRLDGLPLAIELAAARLRLLSVRQIAERLDDRFRLLTSGARTVLPRQQTLRAVVDWSWDLLEEPERAVLRRLAVFSGGADLAAAEAVCAGGGEEARAADGGAADAVGADGGAPEVLDLLGALVDKSLVVAGPGRDGEGMRFRLLETVAEYAGERLEESGERAAAERRHLTYYRELARTTDPELRGSGQVAATALLEREHDNLRGALRTAVALGEEQEVLCLVHSLSWFWQLRHHQVDARTWAVEAGRLGPDPFQVPVRPAEPFDGRCTDVPPPWHGERLVEARRGGRLYALATQGGRGATSFEHPETRARLAALVSAYRPGLPQTCRQPAVMWYFARLMTGEFAGLGETLTAVVDACRDHAPGWDLAFALLMRAKLVVHGPHDATEALALFEAAGDSWGIAESLAARGEARERSGRLGEAATDFERAADAAAHVGARSQVPLYTARLAAVRLRLHPEGDPAAEQLLAEAADAAGEWGAEVAGSARLLLTQHYGHTGRTGLARAQLTRLEVEFGDVTPGLFWGLAGGAWAWLDCLDGAYDRAVERLARAVAEVETLAHLVAPYLLVTQFATAAWALGGRARPGDAETGARLLGAFDAQAGSGTDGGFRPFTPETEALIRARAEETLRAALTPEAYRRLHEEGTGLAARTAAELVRKPGAAPDERAFG